MRDRNPDNSFSYVHFITIPFICSTVAPVLVATSIKQAPVLSKHFNVPQLILHANEPV